MSKSTASSSVANPAMASSTAPVAALPIAVAGASDTFWAGNDFSNTTDRFGVPILAPEVQQEIQRTEDGIHVVGDLPLVLRRVGITGRDCKDAGVRAPRVLGRFLRRTALDELPG